MSDFDAVANLRGSLERVAALQATLDSVATLRQPLEEVARLREPLVQVAALNVRSEADAIAKRLTAKGYQAYVQTPANGPSVFRVRVGTFKTRQEAESVAAKLQKEEQFKPWVTK